MLNHAHIRTIRTPDALHCNFLPVRQVARQLSRLYDQQLAPVALTATQFAILSLLYANPGMSMRELGAALMLERSALLRTMKPLTRDQLIRTGRQAALGARQFNFYLSEAGEGKYRQASPLWQAAQQMFDQLMGETFSMEFRERLDALTSVFVANVSAAPK